ncbi:unnamed protein product [Phytophthora fragariaefolia]|uniref:Unnamed protein product n=1 Tax=Phytophthora fragariaefolia TaxID=1490495 RepID=A0A9W6UE62_9STRA|nr:unnamed protein product [Phytophthora fragariaefolia]
MVEGEADLLDLVTLNRLDRILRPEDIPEGSVARVVPVTTGSQAGSRLSGSRPCGPGSDGSRSAPEVLGEESQASSPPLAGGCSLEGEFPLESCKPDNVQGLGSSQPARYVHEYSRYSWFQNDSGGCMRGYDRNLIQRWMARSLVDNKTCR